MNAPILLPAAPPIQYPDSDGLPMADNTLQFRWIVTIQGGLDALYRHDPNVFVAGELPWYPVEGNHAIGAVPDVLAAFGRPKGDRESYRQWLEGNIPPQVVFNVLVPGRHNGKMLREFCYYRDYGIEEYYLYDPYRGDLDGWLRVHKQLELIPSMQGWVSPRLGVRFEMIDGQLQLNGPDGRKFATWIEVLKQRASEAKQCAERERQRAERLAAQLRALGVEPEP